MAPRKKKPSKASFSTLDDLLAGKKSEAPKPASKESFAERAEKRERQLDALRAKGISPCAPAEAVQRVAAFAHENLGVSASKLMRKMLEMDEKELIQFIYEAGAATAGLAHLGMAAEQIRMARELGLADEFTALLDEKEEAEGE